MESVNLDDYYVLSDEEKILKHKTTGEIVKMDNPKTQPNLIYQSYDPTADNRANHQNLLNQISTSNFDQISTSSIDPTAVSISKWTEAQTSYMLDMYADYFSEVGPLKIFTNKEAMWAFLATKIESKFGVKWSGPQVDTKYGCVMERVKHCNDNNKTSGEVYSESGFENEVNRIVSIADLLVPGYVLSAKRFTRKRTVSSSNSNIIPPSAKKMPVINVESPLPANVESPLPSSSNYESSSSLQETNNESSATNIESPTPPPRRRVRKAAQEKIAEKYFALKQEKDERMENLIRENQLKREKNSALRHADRMERLDKLIKLNALQNNKS